MVSRNYKAITNIYKKKCNHELELQETHVRKPEFHFERIG